VFSFWRHVGRPTRARGYVEGRMLQGGSLSPAVGGGLCQLSTALYEVALQANLTILERHAHSRIVPGPNAARAGRDATVAWNYVDLRFASLDRALRLGAVVTADDLVVSFRAMLPPPSEG
jgi:vancomycin resistance protein VanW